MRKSMLWIALPLLITPLSGAQDSADTPEPQPAVESSGSVEVKHRPRFRLGGISLGAGYHHLSGSPFFRPYYYPYYGGYPYWLDPLYYPAFTRTQLRGPAPQGQVRLRVSPARATVFVDGAYAGTASDLEKFQLPVGAYTLKLSAPGYRDFEQRLYLLSGKKLKVDVDLSPEGDTP